MLVAVVSDTHDDLAMTARVVELAIERGADALVHCGDLACCEVVTLCSRLPFYFVFGNHDADVVPRLVSAANAQNATCLEWGGIIRLGGKSIGVTHGHMTSDLRPLIEAQPDYLLTGHFHETADSRVGKTRRICPGALYRANPLTFALLDLTADTIEFVSMSD